MKTPPRFPRIRKSRLRRAARLIVPPVLIVWRDKVIAERVRRQELADEQSPFAGQGPLWTLLIGHTTEYAEWGMGKSTTHAVAAGCKRVVSVETSRQWLKTVEASIGRTDRFHPIHVDLGPVGAWGRPSSYRERANFDAYFDAPFRVGSKPELLLIDGRFRVACWAQAMISAEPQTLIIFDDYVGRGHYQVVEEISQPIAVAGRQAVFVRPPRPDVSALERLRDEFRHVMD